MFQGPASCCFTDLVGMWGPLHESMAEAGTMPEALDDDIQEAVVLPSGIVQASSLLGWCCFSCRQAG